MTPALMVLGTASHVGKSLITAGLGRIFANDGMRVAPFKAQNMSLNSAATPDGREIGRAQALQAEACRAVPCAEMNPVLIKPGSDTAAQIVVLGRVWGQVTAFDYHTRRVEQLFPVVAESYHRLASRYDLMLLEGAGSPAEINLREHDIVNMRMAHEANAACLLVGDIDRGGVFASLLGTLELLDDRDRERIRGFLINKFRGDVNLLMPGIDMIERRIGIPCAGIVPHFHNHGLEEEDGVAMEDRRTPARIWTADVGPGRPLRVAVIAFPHMANFTDFDALAAEPSVSLAFLDDPRDVARADVVILPGAKQTQDDLAWLRGHGFAGPLANHPGLLLGICGGFQILGLSIDDPQGVENGGAPRHTSGLGLLPVTTVMTAEKTVTPSSGTLPWLPDARYHGYEIHMGETTAGGAPVLHALSEDGRVAGTYIHGLFDADEFRHALVQLWRKQCNLDPATHLAWATRDRDSRLERWAAHLRTHVNLDLLRSWLPLQSKHDDRMPPARANV